LSGSRAGDQECSASDAADAESNFAASFDAGMALKGSKILTLIEGCVSTTKPGASDRHHGEVRRMGEPHGAPPSAVSVVGGQRALIPLLEAGELGL
jgi:hypothetical protein